MPMAEGSEIASIAARLQQSYARISEQRMAGLPILNPRLSVEVVGAREWEGKWLGVLVTPWSINLMLLPLGDTQRSAWAGLAPGTAAKHRFPAGQFEFLVGEEDDLGRTQMCSLFSPVLEFEGHDAARVAAEAALEALLDPGLDEPQMKADAEGTSPQDQSDSKAIDSAQGRGHPNLQVSRRGFLSGRMAGHGGDAGQGGKETG